MDGPGSVLAATQEGEDGASTILAAQRSDFGPIRVFIVEDHPVMTGILVEFPEMTDEMEVCGTAESAEEALERIPARHPSLFSWISRSPEGRLHPGQEDPGTLEPSLHCSHGSGGPEAVDRALGAGAAGFLRKGRPWEIPKTVRRMARGERYLSDLRDPKLGERDQGPFDFHMDLGPVRFGVFGRVEKKLPKHTHQECSPIGGLQLRTLVAAELHIQTAERDMACPRVNALSYWVFLAAGTFLYSSFPLGMAPNAGWFNYVPLAGREYLPQLNIDFFALGMLFLGHYSWLSSGGRRIDMTRVKAVLTDIGGVLLTNSWDRNGRRRAAQAFGIDHDEMDERHHLTFDIYEEGKLSLDRYLDRVVFFRERDFTLEDFKAFMRRQSKPLEDMLSAMRQVAAENPVRMAAITNDTRELVEYRTKEFKLNDFLEFIVASCFVHCRKPDDDIFRIALDLAQVAPEAAVYIDDRAMFTEVAEELGLHAIHHRNTEETLQALEDLGLEVPRGMG